MKLDPRIPVFIVTHDKERHQFVFWCPYCRKDHRHGDGGDGTAEGHRSAHCTTDTPLKKTGYYIFLKLRKSSSYRWLEEGEQTPEEFNAEIKGLCDEHNAAVKLRKSKKV